MTKILRNLAQPTGIALLGMLFYGAQGMAHPTCTTFTVDNASSDTVGAVYVTSSGAPTEIEVTGTGNFYGEVCASPIGVRICGQTVEYPNTGIVTLSDGAQVDISWTNPDIVDITNHTKGDALMR
jgi:hypothetical protein